MNEELAALDTSALILGINEVGRESGNSAIVQDRTTPWLQDIPSEDVWSSWDIAYRDVVVLDANLEVSDIVNTSTYDLREPENYTKLLDAILAARP